MAETIRRCKRAMTSGGYTLWRGSSKELALVKRKRLQATGVQFEGKTEEIPGVVKLATFRDPSGNRLQLCQVLGQK